MSATDRLPKAHLTTELPQSRHRSGTLVPQRATLDGFAKEIARMDGIDIRTVEPLVPLFVRTENSVYRIMLLEPGHSKIMVQGGRFFPHATEGRLAGASFGGSFLKMQWIGIGLCMEIYSGGQRIVTSRVKTITTEEDSTPSGLH
jgi:hypothetical protein